MQNATDAADISVLFFSAGANFWAIFGQFWVNLGNFGSFLVYFGRPFFLQGGARVKIRRAGQR